MDSYCEMPEQNASRQENQEILACSKTISVVGLLNKPDRDSDHVAAHLNQKGYKVIPVNPHASEILDQKGYSNLREVTLPVDIVKIFRKPDAVPAIVNESTAIGAKTVWMQPGIVHNSATDKARTAGLKVVMSRCIMVEHRNLPT